MIRLAQFIKEKQFKGMKDKKKLKGLLAYQSQIDKTEELPIKGFVYNKAA